MSIMHRGDGWIRPGQSGRAAILKLGDVLRSALEHIYCLVRYIREKGVSSGGLRHLVRAFVLSSLVLTLTS